jgi:flagellar motor protein MotB
MSTLDEPYHREGEESYFVSMTDIMVGMVFVFIILLMYFVFRIQNTSEPSIPLSEHRAVVAERDDALIKRDEVIKSLAQAGVRIQQLEAERDDAIKILDEARGRIQQLEAEIERLKRNDLDLYLTNADRDRLKLLESLQSRMKDARIEVSIIPDQGILRLPEAILFKSGQPTIDASAVRTLKSLASALSQVLPCFSLGPASNPSRTCNPNATFIDAVLIEGHTDNTQFIRRVRQVPIAPAQNGGIFGNATTPPSPVSPSGEVEGPLKDNLDLSAQRATNTVREMYKLEPQLLKMYSISPSREGDHLGQGTSPLVNAAAFGETRPAFPNEKEGKARNRRVDVRILLYTPRAENLELIRRLLRP